MQITSTLVMVRPDHFGYNLETAETNTFQNDPHLNGKSAEDIRKTALQEFSSMVSLLRKEGLEIVVLSSRKDAITPDAIFPNNWFTHHQDGTLVVYPMLTPNRRSERQIKSLIKSLAKVGIKKPHILDLSADELMGEILEGTGSLVLDRVNKVAFAMESSRTKRQEFEKWCQLMEYEGIFFHGVDAEDRPIYHTNVVMSIGEGFVLLCLEAIRDKKERQMIEKKIQSLKKEIIHVTLSQVESFCSNMLQVVTKKGIRKIVMSETAKDAFTKEQLVQLGKHGELVSIAIPTIEKVGGGSVRCMLAEVFL